MQHLLNDILTLSRKHDNLRIVNNKYKKMQIRKKYYSGSLTPKKIKEFHLLYELFDKLLSIVVQNMSFSHARYSFDAIDGSTRISGFRLGRLCESGWIIACNTALQESMKVACSRLLIVISSVDFFLINLRVLFTINIGHSM